MSVILHSPGERDVRITRDTAEEEKRVAAVYREFAEQYGVSHWQLYSIVAFFLFGPGVLFDEEWYWGKEEDQLEKDDYDLRHWGLTGVLTYDQLMGICQRRHTAVSLGLARETDPAERKELEEFLDVIETRMVRLNAMQMRMAKRERWWAKRMVRR